ncbi:MAG TPA: hypothetical protein VND65_14255 [Candidatus Binatia bacterium]|nr:hypothetical protein [Candidatus Binatia bacterium]
MATLKLTMDRSFAYISQGQLFVKLGSEAVRPVESQFGESVRSRAAQIQNRNSWKTEGSGARFMSGGLLWGRHDRDAAGMRIAITGVASGCREGELLYSLDTDDVGGLFRLRNHASEEQRLLHTADFRLRRLAACPGQDRVVCVVQHKGQNSSIAVMQGDGTDLREVTQGDTIDDSPRWVPGSAAEIVFQSAAIGRNRAGFPVMQAPFAIQKLDLEAGLVATVAEDPKFDLLNPHFDRDGTLWYIRRPYRDPDQGVSPWRAAVDLVLLPFRLLYAVFQYLNFFTARYTGNTLTTAGQARQKHADVRKMMVWSNLLEADQSDPGKDGETQPLVPKSWELMRCGAEAKEEVVAKGVLAFDLFSDGSVLYTDGTNIYSLDRKGAKECVAKDSLIEQVVAIETAEGSFQKSATVS